MNKNEAIKIIENGSVYKLSAMTTTGAFLIPVGQNGIAMTQPFHLTDKKIQALANTVKNKPF